MLFNVYIYGMVGTVFYGRRDFSNCGLEVDFTPKNLHAANVLTACLNTNR